MIKLNELSGKQDGMGGGKMIFDTDDYEDNHGDDEDRYLERKLLEN